MKYNEFGDIIWSDTLSYFLHSRNLWELSAGQYILVSSKYDEATEEFLLYIANYSDAGILLDEMTISAGTEDTYGSEKVIFNDDHSFLALKRMGYYSYTDWGKQQYLHKFTTAGVLEWEYDLGIDTIYTESMYLKLLKLDDGYLYSCPQRFIDYFTYTDSEKCWQHLIKINFDGETIFDFEFDSLKIIDVVDAGDGEFV